MRQVGRIARIEVGLVDARVTHHSRLQGSRLMTDQGLKRRAALVGSVGDGQVPERGHKFRS